jgi:excisionase family DNA binding protein
VEDGFYSVGEAAKVLKLTPGRVRQMLRSGEIEGVPPEESGERGWRIPMRAVHDRDRPPRVERP